MEWFEKPVRMMRWDYMGEFERLKEVDLEQWAKEKKERWHVNCEWIIGTPGVAPGTGHLTTFAAEGFERYPGFEDFDLLREYLPHAKKYGIKLLVYLNMHWYSYEFAERHPDWEQRTSSGESYGRLHPLYGNGTTFCVNSPWREWAFNLIRETMKSGVDGVFLDGPVVYPDCCYCEYCQEKFEKRYGKPIPKENWLEESWKDFLEFREDSMAEFLRDARRSLKEVNPKGVIFLNSGGWQASSWRVARDIQKVGNYQDFNGAEAFFHVHRGEHNLYESALMAKYLVAGGKPAVVFTHYMYGLWHYNLLPPWEIKRALVQTVACGANPWIAFINKAYESDPGGLKPIEEIQGFLEENEEYYTSVRSEATVAVHSSMQTSTFYISDIPELYRDVGTGKEQDLIVDRGTGKVAIDWSVRKRMSEASKGESFLGFSVALWRGHIPFDVILDRDLERPDRLKHYETLILPNSACLSDRQVDAITNFVKDGGKVVASFETGLYDERGRKRNPKTLDDVLGVADRVGAFPTLLGENYMKVVEDYPPFAEGRLLPRGPYCLKIKAVEEAETPLVFMEPIPRVYMPLTEESEYPALVLSKFGGGSAAYFPQLIGLFYANYKMEEMGTLINQTVKRLNTATPLHVEAPPTVQVEVYSQGASKERVIIHLVNNSGDMKRPISHMLPVENIKIKVGEYLISPRKAYTLRESKDRLEFHKIDGGVEFKIPRLNFYEVVVLEA